MTRDAASVRGISARYVRRRRSRVAAGHGQAIGADATALLDIQLAWTKMRQV
jgi:hypothetical protein